MPEIKIKVGRDATTRKLKLVCGQSTMLLGDPDSVPQSVSKEHLMITIDDQDRMTVTNLNPSNETFVNGKNIMQCAVTSKDSLELGMHRYKVTVASIIRHFVKEKVDISHLEKVWDDYREKLLTQQKKAQRINLLRTVSSLLTTLAIVSGFLFVDPENHTRLYLYGVVIAITVVVTVWSFLVDPSKNERLKEQFQDEYACPKCGYPFGNISFKHLIKRGKCGNCGAQFKHIS